MQDELKAGKEKLRRKGDVISRQEEELAVRQSALGQAAHEARSLAHAHERLQADLKDLQVRLWGFGATGVKGQQTVPCRTSSVRGCRSVRGRCARPESFLHSGWWSRVEGIWGEEQHAQAGCLFVHRCVCYAENVVCELIVAGAKSCWGRLQ